MVRKATVDNDTWTQFLAGIEGRKYSPAMHCGLCANHGFLRMRGLRTPAGFAVAPVEGYCICPNGRAMRFAKWPLPSAQKDKG